jgi:hypothetical protein
MRRLSGLGLLPLLVVLPGLAAGHSKWASIDAYCNQLHVEFAGATPNIYSGPDPWVQLEEVPASMPDDALAYVYTSGPGIRWVFLRLLDSDQGWAEDIDYFFREDGTIAKRVRHLQSAVSHISLEVTTYYAGGRVVKEKTRHHAMGREKPDSSQFSDPDAPVFWTVTDLPFPDVLNVWERLA